MYGESRFTPLIAAALLISTIVLFSSDLRGVREDDPKKIESKAAMAVRGTLLDISDLIKIESFENDDPIEDLPDGIERQDHGLAIFLDHQSQHGLFDQTMDGTIGAEHPEDWGNGSMDDQGLAVFKLHQLDHDVFESAQDNIPAGNLGGDGATTAAKNQAPKRLKIGLISTGNLKNHTVYCDSPVAPYNAFSGRCSKEDQSGENARNLLMTINHGCYAAMHDEVTSIIDTTDYVAGMTMIPTVRNQTAKGHPVDPSSREFAEQRKALPARVPVPPYWNKVHSLKKHLSSYDWLVWMDNDMWISNMQHSMNDLLKRMPQETFMVMPFGDINCFFFIRNSPEGHAFIDRWITMGIKDGGTCEHKFGCWEYHDQGWWFASLIEVIQKYNGVKNDCFNNCELRSLWDCYLNYAKATKKKGLWPTAFQVLNPEARPKALNGRVPPVAVVESGYYRWWGMNLAWGGASGSFDNAKKALAMHHKAPWNGYMADLGHQLGNCYRYQHNYCVSTMKCSARFAADGTIEHGCGDTAPSAKDVTLYTYEFEDGEPGCGDPGCQCWNCSCQTLSDKFGVAHRNRGSLEAMPRQLVEFWHENKCETVPTAPKSERIKIKVAAFNRSLCPLMVSTSNS